MKYGLHACNRLKYSEVEVAGEPTEKLPGALFFNIPGKNKPRNNGSIFLFPLKVSQASFASKI